MGGAGFGSRRMLYECFVRSYYLTVTADAQGAVNSHHFPFMLFHAIGLVIVRAMRVRKRCQLGADHFNVSIENGLILTLTYT